ncbi:MAG TPA: preprotein translocase subunit SecE [Lachnospiraceae bacterium]|nr:preprotein translocase subunit SecE [Lachnospiraceae bacterium]
MSRDDSKAKESKLSLFWKGVKTEFRKIIWPDRDTLVKQLVAVLCVTVISALIIAAIDFGAQNLVEWLTTLKLG